MAIKSLIGIQKNIVLDCWIPAFAGMVALYYEGREVPVFCKTIFLIPGGKK